MRIALGVIGSFVAMAMLTFALSIAPWFIFGVDAVLEPGRFDTTAVINVYSIAMAIVGALVAGWLCATLTKSREAVIALAVLGAIAGYANVVVHLKKPEPGPRLRAVSVFEATDARREPTWYTVLMPCIGPFAIVAGGRRVVRRGADPQSARV